MEKSIRYIFYKELGENILQEDIDSIDNYCKSLNYVSNHYISIIETMIEERFRIYLKVNIDYTRLEEDKLIHNFQEVFLRELNKKFNEPEKYYGIISLSNDCKLIKDKYNWWLIVDNENISIGFHQTIVTNIDYLYNLYKELGYNVTIDEHFEDIYN